MIESFECLYCKRKWIFSYKESGESKPIVLEFGHYYYESVFIANILIVILFSVPLGFFIFVADNPIMERMVPGFVVLIMIMLPLPFIRLARYFHRKEQIAEFINCLHVTFDKNSEINSGLKEALQRFCAGISDYILKIYPEFWQAKRLLAGVANNSGGTALPDK